MRTRIRKAVTSLSFLAVLFLAGTAQAQAPQVRCNESGNIINCRIDQPDVKQHRTEYRAISFHANDRVMVQAGGCLRRVGVVKHGNDM